MRAKIIFCAAVSVELEGVRDANECPGINTRQLRNLKKLRSQAPAIQVFNDLGCPGGAKSGFFHTSSAGKHFFGVSFTTDHAPKNPAAVPKIAQRASPRGCRMSSDLELFNP